MGLTPSMSQNQYWTSTTSWKISPGYKHVKVSLRCWWGYPLDHIFIPEKMERHETSESSSSSKESQWFGTLSLPPTSFWKVAGVDSCNHSLSSHFLFPPVSFSNRTPYGEVFPIDVIEADLSPCPRGWNMTPAWFMWETQATGHSEYFRDRHPPEPGKAVPHLPTRTLLELSERRHSLWIITRKMADISATTWRACLSRTDSGGSRFKRWRGRTLMSLPVPLKPRHSWISLI